MEWPASHAVSLGTCISNGNMHKQYYHCPPQPLSSPSVGECSLLGGTNARACIPGLGSQGASTSLKGQEPPHVAADCCGVQKMVFQHQTVQAP